LSLGNNGVHPVSQSVEVDIHLTTWLMLLPMSALAFFVTVSYKLTRSTTSKRLAIT
jgi:hypothetical protein